MNLNANHRLLILSAILLSSSVSSANSTFVPTKGTNPTFGKGYNSASGQLRANCLEPETIAIEKGPGMGLQEDSLDRAQDKDLIIEEIQDVKQLAETLSLNVSASAKFGLSGGVNAALNYYNSTSFNSYNYYLMISSQIENAAQSIKQPKLTSENLRLLKKNPVRFLQKCGDEYVSTVVTGGRFIAVLEIHTETEDQKNELRQALNLRYGTHKLNQDYVNHLHQVISKYSRKAKIIQAGDSDNFPELEPAALIEFALEFPKKVKKGNNASKLLVSTESYMNLMDGRGADIPDLSRQIGIISMLGDYLDSAISTRNNLRYIEKHSSKFLNEDLTQVENAAIRSRISNLENYIQDMNSVVQECVEKIPEPCKLQKKVPFEEEVPYRTVTLSVNFGVDRAIYLSVAPTHKCLAPVVTNLWYNNGQPNECKANFSAVLDGSNAYFSNFDNYYADNSGTCNARYTCIVKN